MMGVTQASVFRTVPGYGRTLHAVLSLFFLLSLAACGGESPVRPNPPVTDLGFRKLAVVLDRGAAGSWDAAGVAFASVVYDRRELKFRMWYSGFDSTTWRIGYAFSNDGLTWFRHPEPVLQTGAAGSWDSRSVLAPWLVAGGDTLRMWYTGEGATGRAIGAAWSVDGVSWQKVRQNPVFATSGGAEEPAVVRTSPNMWLMLFSTGEPQPRIGIARSTDGLHWTAGAAGLTAATGWDRGGVRAPSLFQNPAGGYTLFYEGRRQDGSWAIGEASSADGVQWTRVGDAPVLQPGAPSEWDSGRIGSPMVLPAPDEASLFLFYSGIDGGWWRVALARRRL